MQSNFWNASKHLWTCKRKRHQLNQIFRLQIIDYIFTFFETTGKPSRTTTPAAVRGQHEQDARGPKYGTWEWSNDAKSRSSGGYEAHGKYGHAASEHASSATTGPFMSLLNSFNHQISRSDIKVFSFKRIFYKSNNR